jgi:hypothetical protein
MHTLAAGCKQHAAADAVPLRWDRKELQLADKLVFVAQHILVGWREQVVMQAAPMLLLFLSCTRVVFEQLVSYWDTVVGDCQRLMPAAAGGRAGSRTQQQQQSQALPDWESPQVRLSPGSGGVPACLLVRLASLHSGTSTQPGLVVGIGNGCTDAVIARACLLACRPFSLYQNIRQMCLSSVHHICCAAAPCCCAPMRLLPHNCLDAY